MEPISTLNFGAYLAQQSKSFPLKGLVSQARQLTGKQNRLEGKQANGTELLNMDLESPSARSNKDKEIMEVAKKFEAILIHQMLKAMRQTVHKSDLLNSFSLQQYESMMDEEIASEMAKSKGIGLADSLFYQLSKLESIANPPTTSSNKLLEVKQYE